MPIVIIGLAVAALGGALLYFHSQQPGTSATAPSDDNVVVHTNAATATQKTEPTVAAIVNLKGSLTAASKENQGAQPIAVAVAPASQGATDVQAPLATSPAAAVVASAVRVTSSPYIDEEIYDPSKDYSSTAAADYAVVEDVALTDVSGEAAGNAAQAVAQS